MPAKGILASQQGNIRMDGEGKLAMKENRQDLSEAGRSLGPLAELIRQVQEGSLTPQMLQAIVERRNPFEAEISQTFRVFVDYGLALDQMIKLGNYTLCNKLITNLRFPLRGAGWQGVELVRVKMNRLATTKEVQACMAEQGLEPAKIEHQLSFDATRPDLYQELTCICLGSSFITPDGNRYYFSFVCSEIGRELNLYWADDAFRWHSRLYFLAVRKS